MTRSMIRLSSYCYNKIQAVQTICLKPEGAYMLTCMPFIYHISPEVMHGCVLHQASHTN